MLKFFLSLVFLLQLIQFSSAESSSSSSSNEDEFIEGDTALGLSYHIVALSIFVMVTGVFLFPVNAIFPLDRRTAAVFGAALVFISHRFWFPSQEVDLIDMVDFDVIVLLASIMVINFLLIKQPEVKSLIAYVKDTIVSSPRKGFWLVGLVTFISAPLLTNDGVCLLFVAPVVEAFADVSEYVYTNPEGLTLDNIPLIKSDALYFMLQVACSSNIGSAITYIGNPQAMLLSVDAIKVMSPIMFLGYMITPSMLAWIATTYYLEWCWLSERKKKAVANIKQQEFESLKVTPNNSSNDLELNMVSVDETHIDNGEMNMMKKVDESMQLMSPRLQEGGKAIESTNPYEDYEVVAPLPYCMGIFVFMMILCIFLEVMSITAIVCTFAVGLTILTVATSYWSGRQVAIDSRSGAVDKTLTRNDKVENINWFFEEMFDSIDLNILYIFIGLFIVIENFETTGIPSSLWDMIVGETPFRTIESIAGISAFILLASQTLGNVPIIALAVPNVEVLNDCDKRLAWAVLSFVSTVGGNLTITGSAANVIVAEQFARLNSDPDSQFDFWKHFDACFWVTLASCIGGATLIVGEVYLDAEISGYCQGE